MNEPNDDPIPAFDGPAAPASYADRTRRLVPGWADLQKMTALLVAEHVPPQGGVLVVGAGGGVELKALAEAGPQWRFTGVDPSEPMLEMAKAVLGADAARVDFHCGYMPTAPAGPFDAATCLLTMHFVPVAQRLPTLQEIHRRLNPGAPYVMAHMSFPQAGDERARWLARYAAFAVASGVDPVAARRAATTIGASLPLLGPDDEQALLEQAGFRDARLFYAGLAFRGWVATA